MNRAELKFLLKYGRAVKYYHYGVYWIVEYHGKWYDIGRLKIGDWRLCEISENEAKAVIVQESTFLTKWSWRKAQKLFGWESIEEYLEKRFGGRDENY